MYSWWLLQLHAPQAHFKGCEVSRPVVCAAGMLSPCALLLLCTAALLRVMSIYSDWLLYFSSVLRLIPFHTLKSSKLAKLLCLNTRFPQYKNCVKFILFMSARLNCFTFACYFFTDVSCIPVVEGAREAEGECSSWPLLPVCIVCTYYSRPPPVLLTPTSLPPSLPFHVPAGLVRGHAPPVHAPGPHADQGTNWQVVQGLQ